MGNHLADLARINLPSAVPTAVVICLVALSPGCADPNWTEDKVKESKVTGESVITALESYEYNSAMSIAVVLLAVSFAMLIVINLLEKWARRYEA